ncbi:MAG: uracil-DNA glycosylase [Deltaproteobacteria bacterium]|nr:uracil-DNA glycosylase [Candidatus Tharpella sp.]
MSDINHDLTQLKAHIERQRELKNPGVLRPQRDPAKALAEIRKELGDCQRCPLHKTRNQLVFGAGDPDAELMFVGEAPGADEDRQGEPFVGRSGQLLSKIIAAIGKTRDQVYIGNIIKCRPPGNRNPEASEIAVCSPFLDRQIEVIQPKVICALGTFAAQTMLNSNISIGKLRGRAHPYKDLCLLVPTFHPAYLLRSPGKKRETWEDMQIIMKLLDWKLS